VPAFQRLPEEGVPWQARCVGEPVRKRVIEWENEERKEKEIAD